MKSHLSAILITLSISFLLMGCGSVTNYTEQKQELARVTFKGNLSDIYVATTDTNKFNLIEKSGASSSAKEAAIELSPGTHMVKVYRGDKLIVNRKLFLSNKDNREILLP